MKKLLLFCFVLTGGTILAQPEYKDVAPIFFARCTDCHNDNTHGPSFLRYSDIIDDAPTMATYLSSNYMPPWTPDTTYTRFAHEHLISTAEKNMILTWIANGTPAGDTTLAPPAPYYGQYHLTGTPDLELQIPTFTSNAIGDDSYVCFSLPTGLTQNRILRAYEIVPGTPDIVHHVVVNVDSTGSTTSDLSGTCYTITGDYSIGAYASGAHPTVFPSTGPLKMGITMKAGSKVVMQLHYPVGSAGIQDSTKIRLYFYPVGTTGVREVYVTTPLQNWLLNIPANTVKTFTAKYPGGTATLPYNLSMFAAFPHSHKICSSIVNYAYAGTDTIPLIRINNWDFDWQGFYTFRNMVKVPAGYKLFSQHVYDNTSSNPHNPSSPPVNVTAGTSTGDEMLFDGFMSLLYQPGDELIDVEPLLDSDTLLSSVNPVMVNNPLKVLAFPNPSLGEINIGYILHKAQKVYLNIYSVQGAVVRSLEIQGNQGANDILWDGKDAKGVSLSAGTYLYQLRTDDQQSTGRLILTGN